MMTEHRPIKLVLPQNVGTLLCSVGIRQRHPGLQLDKLSPPGDQKAQKQEIDKVCEAARFSDLLSEVSKRRAIMFSTIRAERFRASTSGPLTLHLARASGLENAGIHLHPVYGFACLPGSGLKGMARAWAETVWLADQENHGTAWRDIQKVFGWAPQSVADKPKGSRAGSIVFHDAWPTVWPRLEPDIVNNHHKNYYKGESADGPVDWEMPEMVYFLSVATGTTFDFALSPRVASSSCVSRYLTLAKEWLQSALVHEGAGAKTNTGYGRFRLEVDSHPKYNGTALQISTHTLKLVTPAFFAGAGQGQDDCDLRPATIRGQLRWWWRTIHAGHLNRKDLLRLETAIWGDAKNGAALKLSILCDRVGDPQAFNDKRIIERHCNPRSQGIRYVTYGIGKDRWYIDPGAQWTLTLCARGGHMPESGRYIDATEILKNGQIALWLMCYHSGIGSKARKGFGSFEDVEIDAIESIQDCKDAGMQLRKLAGLAEGTGGYSKSSSIDEMVEVLEIKTPWNNSWFALDQLGCVMQSFAQKYKHDVLKAALGLPRKIHGPFDKPMKHQDRMRHQPPQPLRSACNSKRFAAPIHYHFALAANGTLTVRMAAFPSHELPDLKSSRKMLAELRDHMASKLVDRTRKDSKRGKTRPTSHNPSAADGNRSEAAASLPRPGDCVFALLLEEKTKKGGWKAKHEPTGLQGHLLNTSKVPDDAFAGQRVSLIVASANTKQIIFNWPTPEIEARRSKPIGKREQRSDRTKRTQKGRH